MPDLSMRDLRKISAEKISALPGPTGIKSGGRTVGFLTPVKEAPLKKADMARLRATIADIDALAAERDPAEDDALLIAQGIDPTNWSIEAVEALRASER